MASRHRASEYGPNEPNGRLGTRTDRVVAGGQQALPAGAIRAASGLSHAGSEHASGRGAEPADASEPTIARTGDKIRGIVFDMGDVLFDATLWRRWLLRLLVRLGFNVEYKQFFGIWDCDYLDDVHRGRRVYGEAFEAYLCATGLSSAQIDEVRAASQACRRQLEAELRPFPGVRGTLQRLCRSGFALGVLSDSEQPSAQLAQRLRRMGLGDVFQAVVSSVETGSTKPRAICYRTVLDLLALPAPRTIFVGHDAVELAGAAAVGMPTVAFNHQPGAAADRYIDRFEELLGVVGCWSERARAG